MCHVIITPGKAEGAQLSFNSVLHERLHDVLQTNQDSDSDNHTIKIKLLGDGARMTRNSSFILLSFTLLQGADDVMSARGIHTIPVVKGVEKSAKLSKSHSKMFFNKSMISMKSKQYM